MVVNPGALKEVENDDEGEDYHASYEVNPLPVVTYAASPEMENDLSPEMRASFSEVFHPGGKENQLACE